MQSLQTEFSDRLIGLSGGRSGLRSLMKITATPPGDAGSAPVLDFVASDDTLDRYDEIIDAAGWRLENYRRNPVFQNSHKYGDIIFTLGKSLVTEVRNIGGRTALFQRIQFATNVNPMAKICYGLYKGGFLRAVSVGFIPIRWEEGQSRCAIPPQIFGAGTART